MIRLAEFLLIAGLLMGLGFFLTALVVSCAHRPCTMDEWLVRSDCQ